MLKASYNHVTDISEVEELRQCQGINVWSTNQQELENQALEELDIFTQYHPSLEDGEILEANVVAEDNNGNSKEHDKKESEIKINKVPILDIDLFIKRQEELKKRQVFKRSLDVSDKSVEIARKISNKQRTLVKKKKTTVLSFSESRLVKENKTESSLKKRKIDKSEEENHEDRSGSEYFPSDDEYGSDYEPDASEINGSQVKKRKRSECHTKSRGKIKDDGCLQYYNERLKEYHEKIENEPDDEHYALENGLKIPLKIWKRLYIYQRDGVEWLWKIHQKSTGGLLGDEMGLGKTVQIIAFLQGLEYSGIVSKYRRYIGCGPSLIVCPATVIYQWVEHFHDWAPEFRIVVLHQSGSFQGNKIKLIKEINKEKGILVTTYSGILKYLNNLIDYDWHYLILDEGHKIRNPNAKITKAVKSIRTVHRIILTGTPMQNNLQELWSCFDFTNPDILGNLPTFMEHFANPIMQGGFINATSMQEATALSVATTLKNIITPFLLRRSKQEMQEYICLPDKSEQVLFCSLTDEQRDLYKGYLMSDHISSVLSKDKEWYSDNQMKANVLIGITTLKKICNHPDLYLFDATEHENSDDNDEPTEKKFGCYKKSGKMIVVSALLKIWKKQKHRVLLFTQGRAMIVIFEEFLKQQSYKFIKMDGSTPVSSRQILINKFNEDSSYDVFLLTTRVGGLGINLTGADRVIIFDPDWNPATDTQARERAWRIGQDKQVTIYRLLSAGTIEEKMYQRQVWKQLLSNKVLLDPKTQKFFKTSSLYDLFSLPSDNEKNPETTNIFRESRVKIQERLKKDKSKEPVEFSDDKIKSMRELAQKIAKSIGSQKQEAAVVKSMLQCDIEKERKEKLQEKEKLKKLTPIELLNLNREKNKEKADDDTNKIDDVECNLGFDKALEYTEKTAKLYTKVKSAKLKEIFKEEKMQMKEDNNVKIKIDKSGIVDGEKVECLVKCETKKFKSNDKKNCEQDNYVLEKLFSKKGVSGALQHEDIVQYNGKSRSLKVRNEAKARAEKAYEALKKSRTKK